MRGCAEETSHSCRAGQTDGNGLTPRPPLSTQVPFLKEVKKQFMTEFDYLSEAKNLTEVGANMRRHFSATVCGAARPG